jgi:acetolactate synthase I/II/III large subunit
VPNFKVSDYVVRFLAARGVTHAYEVCGGMLAHLLDSFSKQTDVQLVSMHHEQAAGFAAEGHARMTGVPGIAMATSGPGATNLMTPLGSCYFDNTPAVFITGQVNRAEMRKDRPVRQLGFQETDIVSVARPISKDAFSVLDPAEIGNALDRAFNTALSGRRGPVLVDLPMDVQRVVIDLPDPVAQASRSVDGSRIPSAAVKSTLKQLAAAKRPLILLGGGVQSGRTASIVRQAIDHLGVPVVHSLMGVDVLGHEHPLRVGMIGSYGNRWANHALGECDMLLVLGSRLDIRQTGTDTEGFARRRIVHVDVDAAEINNRILGVEAVVGDVGDFCAAILDAAAPQIDCAAFRAHIEEMRQRWPAASELANLSGLNPNVFLRMLGDASTSAAAFVIDVGQHQMWAAQSLTFKTGQRFLTSGGMGSMGFSLPAAVGVAKALAGKPLVVVAGDGGFQLNIQELQTVVRNRLPMKIVVMNNQSHGMVRQFQQSYFESRFQSTVVGYDAPSFAKVAAAYGIPSQTLATDGDDAKERERNVSSALAWLWQDQNGPALLEVAISMEANVYPKLAFGRPITDMEPDAKPTEMEGT